MWFAHHQFKKVDCFSTSLPNCLDKLILFIWIKSTHRTSKYCLKAAQSELEPISICKNSQLPRNDFSRCPSLDRDQSVRRSHLPAIASCYDRSVLRRPLRLSLFRTVRQIAWSDINRQSKKVVPNKWSVIRVGTSIEMGCFLNQFHIWKSDQFWAVLSGLFVFQKCDHTRRTRFVFLSGEHQIH